MQLYVKGPAAALSCQLRDRGRRRGALFAQGRLEMAAMAVLLARAKNWDSRKSDARSHSATWKHEFGGSDVGHLRVLMRALLHGTFGRRTMT